MLEILQFIFSSFWVWLGTFLLVGTIAHGIGNIFCIRIKRHEKNTPQK